MKKQNRKSWTMAYCGMAAALCVALMLLGAVIPIAMFIAPAVAGFLVATVCVECGMQLALTAYAAVSLLALLFASGRFLRPCGASHYFTFDKSTHSVEVFPTFHTVFHSQWSLFPA